MSTLALSLLAIVAVSTLPDRSLDQSMVRLQPARIELHSGRAELIEQGGTFELPRGEARVVLGRAHLELFGSSRLRLAWGGRTSLDLTGPCSLEWQTRADPDASPFDLYIRFHELASAQLEVRRGLHEIVLPGDWHMKLGAGALDLVGRVDGLVEIRLHAGPALPVRWLGDSGQPRPPLWLSPGRVCQLIEPPLSPPDVLADAPAWEVPSWPWSRNTEDVLQRRARERLNERLRRSQRAGPWPDSEAAPPAGEVAAALPVAPPQEVIEVRELAPEKEVVIDKAIYLQPGKTAPIAREDYKDHHWRGVRWEHLRWAGPVIAQQGPGLEVSEVKGGRFKVVLTAAAKSAIWVFGPGGDMRLEPGAVILFDSDGRLEGRFGRYLPQPVVSGRPTESLPPVPSKGPSSQPGGAPAVRQSEG